MFYGPGSSSPPGREAIAAAQSLTAVNVRLLCARCNLKKFAKIEVWLPFAVGLASWRL